MRYFGRLKLRHLAALFTIALCDFAFAASAEPVLAGEYSRRIWRVQDGLPQSRIQVISQTPDGYLWIGTPSGLVRFDGARFFVFDRVNTPAFRDDSILSLHPSKDGSLWIGTEGGGLMHYVNGSFRRFGAEEGLSNGFIRALHEDPQGILWIGSDRGLFRLQNDKIERLDGRGDIPVTAVSSLRIDPDGKMWISSNIGLMVVEQNTPRRYVSKGAPLQGVRAYNRSGGGLWLLTAAGVARLQDGAVIPRHTFADVRTTTLYESRNGDLWIGTFGEGLLRLNSNGVTSYRTSGGLPDDTVIAIYEDRAQNLWIGTHDGLLRLSKAYVRTLSTRDGLANDNVSNIWEGRDGAVWLTTITGTIQRFANGRLEPVLLPAPFQGTRARVVFQDKNGDLWIGTSGDGLLRVSAGKVASFTTKDGLRNTQIRQFFEDRRGDLWIGLGSGVIRWDGLRFHNYYIEDGLAYGSVRVVTEDHTGDVLVGTEGGLNRVHEGKFVSDPLFSQLQGERIWAIHEDADHTLWVGTRGNGLLRLKNGKVNRITIREGLPSNAIYAILEGGTGNFWMSSPAGVFSASRAELNRVADGDAEPLAIAHYGVADGMESNQMNAGVGPAGCRTASGELWFASVKGAVRIDPSQHRINDPARALIESVIADDMPLPLSGDLRIPAGHGRLQIGYTACNLLSPERISFKYRLEGFEEGWTAGASQRVAYYTNLPPGSYRFRVIVTDSAAPRQTSEAALSFVWHPHFYQTKLFYWFCAAAAAMLLWAALRIYARQTKARYAMLLSERTRLAREMHDTIIQGCVGVSTLLEAASGFERIDTRRMTELVDHARAQVRLTLDEARQAVWNLRQAGLESDIAGSLGELARQLSSEKGFPIEVEIAGSPPQFQEQTLRSILLVAREAVRNAANHASPRHINIRMAFDANEARLEVVDDGRGFAPTPEFAGTNGHYGIVGMRERVEELGGDFQLRSSPGQGTAVIVRLPLREGG